MTCHSSIMARGEAACMGSWYMATLSTESALDRLCAEVESSGGVVFSISESRERPRTGIGAVKYRRVFTVVYGLTD